jgi:DNA polymerase I-like protein with 3'-5' exonuclease and polymerase domains
MAIKKPSLIVPASKLPEDCSDLVVIADTEGTGLHKLADKPFMAQFRINKKSYAVEWSPNLVRWITDNAPKIKVFVFQNAKFDYHMMINGGVNEDALYYSNIYCTFVAEALLNEHRFTYGLSDLGLEYFGTPKRDDELLGWLADYFKEPKSKKLMSKIQFAPREIVADYGIGDVELTEKLFYRQQPLIRAQELERVVSLEMECLKVLAEIERRGVPVNAEKAQRVEQELIKRQELVQQRIVDLVGWPVNPRSPNQMVNAFEKLGIPIRYLKTGNPTFAAKVIDEINNPFTTALKESRGIKTMLDTFISGSIGTYLWTDGRIHTDFNQVRGDDYGTGTGRLSSSQPNLQQVPKRDGELAPMVRGLFVPPKGMKWLSNDWEQFEFRIFAHYVNDPELTARYIADPTTDFHQALSDKTRKPRDKAKRINLGLVFGMGEGKLASELGLPFTEETGRDNKVYLKAGPEAKQLFAEYHESVPGVKAFLTQASNLARSRGYVKTIYGRRIRFPGGMAVHKAGGLVFQGTAADLMKKKLVELNNLYRKTENELVLVVHDEFDLLVPQSKTLSDRVAKRVKAITEDIPELRIPILSKASVGTDWWEASK